MSRILLPVTASSRRRGGYLYQQDFAGAGAPPGWTFDGTGTCNYDWTGPDGMQAVRVASTTNSALGGAQFSLVGLGVGSTFGWYCRQWFDSVASLNRNAWHLNNSAFNIAANDTWNGANVTISGSTWYHMWIDATPSQWNLFLSPTATKPGTPTATINGSYSAPTRIAISLSNSSGQNIAKIRIAAGPIGSAPI